MPDSAFFYELLYGFGLLLSSAVGNPTPEEVMIVGFGVRAGLLSDTYPGWCLLLLPAVLAGALVTDVILYGIGRVIGGRYLHSQWMRRLAPPEKRERIRANFHRYGFLIFAFGRLVPGIRTTLFLTAGTMKLDLKRFLLADGVGALLGGSLFFFLGYGLGSRFATQFTEWDEQFAPYKTALIVGLVVLIGAYLLYLFLRNPIPTGDPEDVPLIGHQIATHLPNGETPPPASEQGQAEPLPRGRTAERMGRTPGK